MEKNAGQSKTYRICVFCERWESGGIEAFLSNVISLLDKSQYSVHIVCAEQHESVFTQQLKDCGVCFIELSGKQQKQLKNHRMFRQIIRKKKYDAVYINCFHAFSQWYAHIAKQEGVPIRIVHSHNTALRRSRTRWLKMVIHTVSRDLLSGCATRFAACSESAARFMFPDRLLQRKGYTFIPNGIDTQRFRFNSEARTQIRREFGINEKFVIGNVGRLCYQKNQQLLIEAMPYILKAVPESCLLLIGEGEEMGMLKARAQELGIEDHVIFLGTVKYVENYLWAMDVFAFPSRFEGLPVAVIEAQAAGLQTVISDCITSEVILTELVITEALQPAAWGTVLSQIVPNTNQRERFAEAVDRAGFGIEESARKVETLFQRE